MGGSSREHRIQVQPVVYCAQIPEHRPAGADGLKIRRDGQALLLHGGVQPRISAPRDLGDVVVAQGQPFLQALGGGQDEIGLIGQIALQRHRQVMPEPVAVVDEPMMGDVIQHQRHHRRTRPQQRFLKPVAFHLLVDQLNAPPDGAGAQILAEQGGGEGVNREVGQHMDALGRSRLTDGRLEEQDLHVRQMGHQPLGAEGRALPRQIRDTDHLCHLQTLPS